MTFSESLLIALYCMVGVMILLAVLYYILVLFSKIFGSVGNKNGNKKGSTPVSEVVEIKLSSTSSDNEFSTGQLKLKDVDEPTAAMIMAIISDESGIPLSQLRFKSIKLLQVAQIQTR